MSDANHILPDDPDDHDDPDGKIKSSALFGEHITLTCVNHPHLRWTTKNIAPLGCRTIFYTSKGSECECKMDKLRVVE